MFTAVSLVVVEAAGNIEADRWEFGQEEYSMTPKNTMQELEATFRYTPTMWTQLKIMVLSEHSKKQP